MTKQKEKITIEIDGERYEMQNDGSEHNLSSDIEHVSMKPDSDGMYLFHDNNKIQRIKVVDYNPATHTYTIEWGNQLKQARILRELDLLIEKMGLNTLHSKKLRVMEAPMPGLVTSIKVAPGDHVLKGAPLLILEAMKMENVIAAPHEATIKEVKVKMGQAVERGLPLIEFE